MKRIIYSTVRKESRWTSDAFFIKFGRMIRERATSTVNLEMLRISLATRRIERTGDRRNIFNLGFVPSRETCEEFAKMRNK